VKTIERHFGCPVVCGTPRNAIIFRATDANRPFVTRNAELLGILAPQFDEELKEENGDENFIEHVRIAIQQRLTGRRPTIEDGADVLHISSRTLQRRLQDEGSSFQRVLEEARHQLPTFSDMRTETPSFALSALGREFHRLDGASNSVQGRHRNRG
jgi:hypothetical protein